jgi:2-keto-4-pentenoate hydratase/2-oxohepta-3-ene-1,7-dioic acid hydratase in catechol pathway
VSTAVVSKARKHDLSLDVLIESLSQGLTLETGDILATGTPDGVGFARAARFWDGDVMKPRSRRDVRNGRRALMMNGPRRRGAREA